MRVDLVLLNLGDEPRAFPITRPVTLIGRADRCDLTLAHPRVSRRHAKLIVSEGHVRVEDLNSTNGTYVNTRRVQRAELSDGDDLAIGPLAFAVRIRAEGPAETPQRPGAESVSAQAEPDARAPAMTPTGTALAATTEPAQRATAEAKALHAAVAHTVPASPAAVGLLVEASEHAARAERAAVSVLRPASAPAPAPPALPITGALLVRVATQAEPGQRSAESLCRLLPVAAPCVAATAGALVAAANRPREIERAAEALRAALPEPLGTDGLLTAWASDVEAENGSAALEALARDAETAPALQSEPTVPVETTAPAILARLAAEIRQAEAEIARLHAALPNVAGDESPTVAEAAAADDRTPRPAAVIASHPAPAERQAPPAQAREVEFDLPLHQAVRRNDLGMVSLLLAKGADVNARVMPAGYTALHLAAENGYVDLVRLLLVRGAAADVRTRDGRTPLEAAQGAGHLPVAELLRKRGG